MKFKVGDEIRRDIFPNNYIVLQVDSYSNKYYLRYQHDGILIIFG